MQILLYANMYENSKDESKACEHITIYASVGKCELFILNTN